MKKLFMAFLAVATIAMVGCKKDEPTPTPTPTPGPDDPTAEIPDIPAPAADKMILLVNVAKDINICNTIAMRGAMTNYATDAPILFEKVEGYDTWYKAEMPAYTNADFFHCKLMIAAEDGTASYDNEGTAGQYELLNGADEYLLIDDDFGTENCLSTLNDVEVGGKILCVAIKAFKGNPCVAKIAYKITLKMAYAGDEYAPAVTGSFNSWAAAEPMKKVSDTEWNVEVEAQAGNEFKFQSTEGDWKNEIQVYDAETDTWAKMDNITLTEDKNPVFDFTDAAKYRWSKAAAPEPFVIENHVFSLIGDAVGGWTAANDVNFTYGDDQGDFYVCEIGNLAMGAGAFKIRENGGWDVNFGWGAFEILGDVDNFEEAAADGNVNCKAAQTYTKITFKFKWDGHETTDRSVTFTT